ncbi:MAG: type IV toxin-antitoxin system AbiEi family antitoxin domain-containing protein [Dermatophilaceae bacterium]
MIDVPALLLGLPPVFGLREAGAGGLSARTLERAVRGGEVRRLARGVFVADAVWRSGSQRDRHLLLVRASLCVQPRGVISHHSAAVVLGLPIPWRLPCWVAMTTGGSARTATPGTLLRLEPAALPRAAVVVSAGMVVTSVDRTVIDCLRELPLADAVAIGDAALRSGSVSPSSLRRTRSAQRGWPYIKKAEQALPILDGRRENWFESWSFTQLWQLGIELPEPQVNVYDRRGRFLGRVDGLWQDGGVVAEADGSGKYLGEFDPNGASGSAAARIVVAEKEREDRIRDCGLEFVRWGVAEMARDPRAVAARIDRARERGDFGRFRGRLELMPRTHPRLLAPKPPFRGRNRPRTVVSAQGAG